MDLNKIPFLTRRRILLGAGMTGALTMLGGCAATKSAAAIDRDESDADRFVRMRTSEDGKPVMWVYGGVMLVKPEGKVARPLVGVGGVSMTRATEVDPGVYDWQLDEVGYYTDLKTGKVVDTTINPFTGKEVKMPHYRAPEHFIYQDADVLPAEDLPPEIEVHGEIVRLSEVAGISAMTEDIYVSLPAVPAKNGKPARPSRQLSSLGTYTASTEQLDGPAGRWIDCGLNYSTMNSFAPFLGMGGVSGVQNLRLSGRKCRYLEEGAIPEWFGERVSKDYPDYLEAPKKWG